MTLPRTRSRIPWQATTPARFCRLANPNREGRCAKSLYCGTSGSHCHDRLRQTLPKLVADRAPTPAARRPSGLTWDSVPVWSTGSTVAAIMKNFNSCPEAAEVLRRADGSFDLIRSRQPHCQVMLMERSKFTQRARAKASAMGTLSKSVEARMRGTSWAARIRVPSARISLMYPFPRWVGRTPR